MAEGGTTMIGRAAIGVTLAVEPGAARGLQNSISRSMDGSAIGRETGASIGSGIQREVSESGEASGESFGKKLLAGFAALGVGSLLVKGITSSLDNENIAGKMASQMGLSTKETQKWNAEIKSIFSSGYGESMEAVSGAFSSVVGSIQGARDKSGKELQQMTKDVLNVEKVFGYSSEEINNAVSSMMGSGLTSDFNESLNTITTGLQNFGGKGEDLLDTFREYSGDFAGFGLSGTDSLNIMNGLLEAGVMNSDKAADGIREMFTRIRNGDKATMESLDALGLNSGQIQKDFTAGGEKAKEAYTKVIQSINKSPDAKLKSDAITGVFGSVGEDFFNAFNQGIPADFSKGIQDVNGSVDQINRNMETNSQKLEAWKRTAQVALVDFMGSTVIPVFEGLAPIFKPLLDGLQGLVEWGTKWKDVIAPIAVFLGTFGGIILTIVAAQKVWTAVVAAYTVVQGAMNAVMLANPIGLIVIAVIALVAAFVYAYNHSETFRNMINGLWEGIKSFFAGTWELISSIGQNVWDFITNLGPAIQSFIGGIGEWISGAFSNVMDFFAGIGQWFANVWTSIGSGATGALTGITDFISGVWEGFTAFLSNATTSVVTIFQNAITWVSNLIGNIWGGLTNIFSSIGTGISNAFNFIMGFGTNVLNFFGGVISGIFSKITGFGSQVGSFFGNMVGGVTNFVGGLANNVGNFIGGVINNARNGIGGVMNFLGGLGQNISNIFGNIGNVIMGAFNGVTGVVRGVINFIIDGINRLISAANSIRISVPKGIPVIGGKSWGGPNIATIPGFATGGTIRATPGGTIVRVGEGGRDETIIDTGLHNRQMARLERYDINNNRNNNGSGSVYEISMHETGVTPAELARELMRRERMA